MARFKDLIMESDVQTLEKVSFRLKKNDTKIAAQLYRNLSRLCKDRSIIIQAEGRRIKKIQAYIGDTFVMAKPIIINNKLMLFYKKHYYSVAEVFDSPKVNDFRL